MKRIALAALLLAPLGTLAGPARGQAAAKDAAVADPHAAPAASSAAARADPAAPPASGASATAPKGDAAPPSSAKPATAAAGTPAATSPAAPAAPAIKLAAKALAVKPGHYRLDLMHGKVTWSVNHLGFSTYVGQFSAVAADLVIDPKDPGHATLTATVDTGSVSTANPKLDAELKGEDWFNTAADGPASFRATSIAVTGGQTARVDGALTLHGKTAPIVISATFNNAGVDPVDKQYTVGFDAAAIIRRSTFGITKYVPLVSDNVTLRLEGEFKPAQQ